MGQPVARPKIAGRVTAVDYGSGTRDPGLGIRDSGLGTRDSELGVGRRTNAGPESRIPSPGAARAMLKDDVHSEPMMVRRAQGGIVGFIHVPVTVTTVKASAGAVEAYAGMFLVDTGSMDSVIPASELRKIGIEPVAAEAFELADGSIREFAFGLAQLEVMGKITAGPVLFGPEGVEPLLGVAPLRSAGFTVDPASHTLRTIRLRV